MARSKAVIAAGDDMPESLRRHPLSMHLLSMGRDGGLIRNLPALLSAQVIARDALARRSRDVGPTLVLLNAAIQKAIGR